MKLVFRTATGFDVVFTKRQLLQELDAAMLHCNSWNHTRQGQAVELAVRILKRMKSPLNAGK